jgi:membrane fusion protein (multidrug efflux system)
MGKATAKRMVIMLVIVTVILGGVVGFQRFKNAMIEKSIKGQGMPVQTVATTTAEMSAWQPSVDAVGSFSASRQASLSSEVGGLVTEINFDSGEDVRAGDPLVELNAAPLKAQLAQLEAQTDLAKITLKRDEAQLEAMAVSQATVDTDRANLKALQAQIQQQKAMIEQKRIAAPFAGKLGIRQVNLGQYIAAGAPVVTLQQLDPMEFDFTVPQNEIDLIRIGMEARISTNAQPGRVFPGKVTAIEPQIDASTRNLKVRARVENPKGELLPGVFGTVNISHGEQLNFVTLPNSAINYNPFGATVFIVKEGGKNPDGSAKLVAEQRFVTVGLTRGDQVAVVQGVKAGEAVVTAGQLKLRNGSPVTINNSVQPANNPNPKVPNS